MTSGCEQKKTLKLVITFFTTTAAMAMDSVCASEFGRLIPIPGELRGGCGLAWCAGPEYENVLLELMEEYNILYQDKQIIAFY